MATYRYKISTFIERVQQVHQNKYDYSLVTQEQLITGKSKIKIFCRKCGHLWQVACQKHLEGSGGCPECDKRIFSWTKDKRKIKTV